MWRNQSKDQTTISLSLFVNLQQVKGSSPVCTVSTQFKSVFRLLTGGGGSACNPYIICHSTLSMLLIHFIQHSTFLLMAPQTLQNQQPVDNHPKCLNP